MRGHRADRRGADSRSESSVARHFDLDPTLVRVAWAVLSIVPGSIVGGALAYVVAALLIPEAPRGRSPEPEASQRAMP